MEGKQGKEEEEKEFGGKDGGDSENEDLRRL